MKDNFADAYETPLGPGEEYRAQVAPFIRPTGGWTDAAFGPFRQFNAALLLGIPEAADGLVRGSRAIKDSAVDAFVEQSVSSGVSRGSAERLGRELKAMPEAFLRAPLAVWPGIPRAPVRPIRQFTGQQHHGISRLPHRSLEKHPNLWGYYEHRDPRFVTQAVDPAAHRGWFGWHKPFDEEVAKYIDEHPNLTPETFEAWLSWRYDQPDMAVRFPNGLRKNMGERR